MFCHMTNHTYDLFRFSTLNKEGNGGHSVDMRQYGCFIPNEFYRYRLLVAGIRG